MSKLKHQLMLNKDRSWVPCYLKSEADKVIAELKDKLRHYPMMIALLESDKKEIAELKKEIESIKVKFREFNKMDFYEELEGT